MKHVTHEIVEYICDDCNIQLGNHLGHPYYSDDGSNYCLDCALKRNLIGADEWLRKHGITIYHYAVYKDGVITAYQKCGRKYKKDVVKIFENSEIKIQEKRIKSGRN